MSLDWFAPANRSDDIDELEMRLESIDNFAHHEEHLRQLAEPKSHSVTNLRTIRNALDRRCGESGRPPPQVASYRRQLICQTNGNIWRKTLFALAQKTPCCIQVRQYSEENDFFVVFSHNRKSYFFRTQCRGLGRQGA